MGEFLPFWPKNEKWSRKNDFEIPPCRNFKSIIHIIERRIFTKIVKFSNENEMFYP